MDLKSEYIYNFLENFQNKYFKISEDITPEIDDAFYSVFSVTYSLYY